MSNNDNHKSDINLFYNDTKGGVDTIEQMARKYTTKRSTRMADTRWPLSIFYIMLDIAALNAYSLLLLGFPKWNKKKTNRRRLFLKELGLALILLNIEHRADNITGLSLSVLERKLVQPAPSRPSVAIKGRCHSCCSLAKFKKEKTNKLGKTTIVCSKCA